MTTLTRSSASLARQADEAMREERARMKVYRRAFRWTLALIPYQGGTVLSAVDAVVAALSSYDPLRMAWIDVVLFERPHPDIELLRVHPSLNWTPAQMDAVFQAAMSREAGGSQAQSLAILAPQFPA
jgi:hypothetical protein